jgi:hypothetical protein
MLARNEESGINMNVFSGPEILLALWIAMIVFVAWVICKCWREFIGALRQK